MSGDAYLLEARALKCTESWQALLTLAEDAWVQRSPNVEVYTLAAEACLRLGMPILAIRWITRADQGGAAEFRGRLDYLRALAILATGNAVQAERFFLQAYRWAIQMGDQRFAAVIESRLESLASASGSRR